MSTRRYCRCGTVLAADNTNRTCSACQATRQRDRAPDLPADFWRTDVMAAALASGDLGRVIRAYRCHPFHGERLSQTIVAGWLHMSQAAVCRIENARRRVTIDEIALVARTLGMPVALPWIQHPSQAREDVDPLSRRSLLGAGVGTAIGLNATTAPTAARDIDPELIQHWIKLLRLLDHHGAMYGPHSVRDSVRRELGLIAEHRRVASGELRIDLLRVEARWSDFASWLSYDMGDSHGRDAWASRALGLAREADWPDLITYVFTRRSHWAAKEHDARRAISFAETGLRTEGVSDEIRAVCTLREAQGHALANDIAACERSLADAQRLLDVDIARTPWGDVGRQEITPEYHLAADARCWLSLRPSKAITMYEDVLHRWPPDRTRDRGLQQVLLGLACAAADEPDRAAAEGIEALSIAKTTKSDVVLRELKRLDRELAACDLPAAADFREAFAAV